MQLVEHTKTAQADEAQARLPRLDARQSLPGIHAALYDRLPLSLGHASAYFDEGTPRAVFLLGALPVVAALISRGVEVVHADGYYSPDLYTCIVAPPASGKGALRWSRALGRTTDSRLYEESEAERARWRQLDSKAKAEEPEPPKRSLYVPARASVAAMLDLLSHTGGRACIYEEEIDSLAGTLGQEWGDYSDILRKAFHHEPVGSELKNERIRIDRPALSVMLSGTPDQFRALFEAGVQNGLYSRFGFYYFEASPGWKSHRPRARHHQRGADFAAISRRLDALYSLMRSRSEPLRVQLSPSQWDMHDEAFERMVESPRIPRAVLSNIHRLGIVACRTSAVLSVLRLWDDRQMDTLARSGSVTCTDMDVATSLHLAEVMLMHCLHLFDTLGSGAAPEDLRTKQERQMAALRRLPVEFGSGDMIEVGAELGVSKSTMYTYRAEWEAAGLVEPGGAYGRYLKTHAGLTATAQDDDTP